MTFKVNYGFQKAERDRAKLAKKEAKRREKEGGATEQPRTDHQGPVDSAVGNAAPGDAAAGDESTS